MNVPRRYNRHLSTSELFLPGGFIECCVIWDSWWGMQSLYVNFLHSVNKKILRNRRFLYWYMLNITKVEKLHKTERGISENVLFYGAHCVYFNLCIWLSAYLKFGLTCKKKIFAKTWICIMLLNITFIHMDKLQKVFIHIIWIWIKYYNIIQTLIKIRVINLGKK